MKFIDQQKDNQMQRAIAIFAFFTLLMFAGRANAQDNISKKCQANFYYAQGADNTLAFFNRSKDNSSCKWWFGDGNVSDETNPIYSYQQPGYYALCLVVKNDLSSDTLFHVINVQKTFPNTASVTDEIMFDKNFAFTETTQKALTNCINNFWASQANHTKQSSLSW